MAERIDFSTFEYPDGSGNVGVVCDDVARNQIAQIKKTISEGGGGTGGSGGGTGAAFIGSDSDTDGVQGEVPAPEAGDQNKFLSGDGTWKVVPVPKIDTVTYKTATILASGWTGSGPYVYDMSAIGSEEFMIVKFDGSKGSASLLDTVELARIQSGADNKLYAFGDKPDSDIPVVCCMIAKHADDTTADGMRLQDVSDKLDAHIAKADKNNALLGNDLSVTVDKDGNAVFTTNDQEGPLTNT